MLANYNVDLEKGEHEVYSNLAFKESRQYKKGVMNISEVKLSVALLYIVS